MKENLTIILRNWKFNSKLNREEIKEKVSKDSFAKTALSIVDETREILRSLGSKAHALKIEIVKAISENEKLNLAFIENVKKIPF